MRCSGKYPLLVFIGLLLIFFMGNSGCIQQLQNLWEPNTKQNSTSQRLEENKNETRDIKNEKQQKITVYYLDEQKHFLIPVTKTVLWTEGIARETIKHLVSTPQRVKHLKAFAMQPILPEGTELLGININEGIAYLDFNDAFLTYDAKDERLIMDSLLFTLIQFPTIEKVSIMVEGTTIETFPGGTPGDELLGPERSINLEIDSNIEHFADISQVEVYFCYYAGEKFFYVPITRVIPQTDTIINNVIEELLAGPHPARKLFSNIPEQTKALSISQDGDLVTIDFSTEILTYQGGKQGEENIVNQIMLTLTKLPQIDRVQILVEGEKAITEEDSPLGQILERPTYINEI